MSGHQTEGPRQARDDRPFKAQACEEKQGSFDHQFLVSTSFFFCFCIYVVWPFPFAALSGWWDRLSVESPVWSGSLYESYHPRACNICEWTSHITLLEDREKIQPVLGASAVCQTWSTWHQPVGQNNGPKNEISPFGLMIAFSGNKVNKIGETNVFVHLLYQGFILVVVTPERDLYHETNRSHTEMWNIGIIVSE